MRGMKTFSMILVPVMIRASMTLVSSCVTIILVPLHRPPIRLRFRRSIIGASTFSSSLCGGNLTKCREFRYSLGYNNSVSLPRCHAVLPRLSLESGIQRWSGMCTDELFSGSTSSATPILPSPIFRSQVEKV
nr:hypothetical protein [Tanacetum cinerariifolium]